MAWLDAEKTRTRLAQGDVRAEEIVNNLYSSFNEDIFSSTVYGLMFLGLKGSRLVDAFLAAGKNDLITFVRLVRERSPVLDQYRNK